MRFTIEINRSKSSIKRVGYSRIEMIPPLPPVHQITDL